MRYIMLAGLLVVAMSCRKTISSIKPDNQLVKHVNSVAESKFVTADLDSALLRVTMKPEVECYSYRNGETPKPCNIFVDFTCTVSKPIRNYITVEIERTKEVTVNTQSAIMQPGARITITLAPYATSFTFKSNLTNQSSNTVADGEFSIVNIRLYDKID